MERGLIDPKTVMAIRSLELRARIIVEGFWSGLHRSPFHGFSVEFTEYRPYSAGEDTRYLDWRLYARSDRYYLKRFEDETNLRCYLVVDQSRSMAYKSIAYSKADYARTLAATLAWFLHGQGDATGLIAFAEHVRDYLPARHRRGHLRQLLLALEREVSGTGTDFGEPLQRAADLMRQRSLLVFISDMLAPLPHLEKGIARLAAAGHETVVIQVLDPNDVAFDFPEEVMLRDLETGGEFFIDPTAARSEYLRKFGDHCRAVELMCRNHGAEWIQLQTKQPLELALGGFLRSRARRGKVVRRRHQRGVAA